MIAPAVPTLGRTDTLAGERFVTCVVADETYAVPALSVREVLRWLPVTRIPHGGPSMKGVINLRGEIVPLVDLRVLFGLPAAEPSDRTCIVVLSLMSGNARLQAGLIVDVALEVVRIPARDVSGGAEALPGPAGRYITGIAQTKDGLLMLLACEPLIADALSGTAAGARS